MQTQYTAVYISCVYNCYHISKYIYSILHSREILIIKMLYTCIKRVAMYTYFLLC